MINYYKIKKKLNRCQGALGVGVIIAGFVLLAAYMMYPDVFYDFFKFIREQFFQNLDSSFSDDPFGDKEGSGEEKTPGDKKK